MRQVEQLYNSTADRRASSQAVRHQYRVLSQDEKDQIAAIKDMGAAMLDFFEQTDDSREMAIAKTKIEEAVMWAVKAITA